MKLAYVIIQNKKLIFSVMAVFAFLGIIAWFTMPREEDPRMAERAGSITVIYPGATPENIEQFVVKPLEDEISEMSEIDYIETTVRSEIAFLRVILKDSVIGETTINDAWRDVKDAMNRAAQSFPEGISSLKLDRHVTETAAFVFAIGGEKSLLELKQSAEDLKDALLSTPLVSRVKLYADPGEQITISISDVQASRLGLSYFDIARQLNSANLSLPAGIIRQQGRSLNIQTNSSFKTIDEIRAFPVLVSSGQTVPLGNIARIERSIALPEIELMTFNGKRTLGVGAIPEAECNILFFDKNVRKTLAEFKSKYPDVKIDIISAQPEYVRKRLSNLSQSLISGMVIIALVLFIGMGLRVGAIVAFLLPIIAMISLAIYSMGGGVLHQLSIAALVMALGILIDNVIVVVEGVQERLDSGESSFDAAVNTIREFAFPLFTSTGTTVASFLPMLGSQGGTADFTRAIPIVAIIALVVSYLFSVLVTPAFSMSVLHKGGVRHWSFLETLGVKIGLIATRKSWLTLASVGIILALFLGMFPFVKKRFFPSVDRNQIVVDIRFPEGTHFTYTREKALEFELELRKFKEVQATAAFVGNSTPHFYYNLSNQPQSPHLAQILVQTQDFNKNTVLKKKLTDLAQNNLFDAEVIVRYLEQGPPIIAPIEIRLFSDSSADAMDAAELLVARLRENPQTENARTDAGIGVPVARFSITDATALQYGQSRSSVTQAILGRIRGISAGSYRGNQDSDDPLPIRITSYEGEELPLNKIADTYLMSTFSGDLHLSALASPSPDWEKSVIRRRDRKRVIRVLSELKDGAAINEVMPSIETTLKKLPQSVTYEIGGEESKSSESSGALASAMPLGMILLLVFLMLEFHSYRKMLIILVSVPAAMAGIFPGLLLTGNSFGFLSLLAGLALIGIVVNNGILLISYVEEKRSQGESINQALEQAISRRLRPILLTTGTTIAGMIPLAITSSTLWPPFAWSMMTGLFSATIIALFAVPALYKIIYSRSEQKGTSHGRRRSVAVLLILLVTTGISAKEISLDDALDMAGNNSDSIIAWLEAKQVSEGARAQRYATYFPHVNVGGGYNFRKQDLHIETPFGNLDVGSPSYLEGGISVEQNLFDPANMLYAIPSAQKDARAAEFYARQRGNFARLQVVLAWSKAREIQIRMESMRKRLNTLRNQSLEVRRNYRFGRASRADLMRISTAVREADVILASFKERYVVSLQEIAWLINEPEKISLKNESTEAKINVDDRIFAEFEKQLEKRPDILAANEQIEAARLRMRAVSLEPLPQIYASGKYEYSEASLYKEKGITTVAIGARLPLFQGGSRIVRYREKETELKKKEEEKKQLVLRARFELQHAWSDYRIARSESKRYRRLYSEAATTAAIERREFLQGKRSLFEVISAENTRIDWHEKSQIAELDMLRALARVQFLSGVSVFARNGF